MVMPPSSPHPVQMSTSGVQEDSVPHHTQRREREHAPQRRTHDLVANAQLVARPPLASRLRAGALAQVVRRLELDVVDRAEQPDHHRLHDVHQEAHVRQRDDAIELRLQVSPRLRRRPPVSVAVEVLALPVIVGVRHPHVGGMPAKERETEEGARLAAADEIDPSLVLAHLTPPYVSAPTTTSEMPRIITTALTAMMSTSLSLTAAPPISP